MNKTKTVLLMTIAATCMGVIAAPAAASPNEEIHATNINADTLLTARADAAATEYSGSDSLVGDGDLDLAVAGFYVLGLELDSGAALDATTDLVDGHVTAQIAIGHFDGHVSSG